MADPYSEFGGAATSDPYSEFGGDTLTPDKPGALEQIGTSLHNQAKGLYQTIHALATAPWNPAEGRAVVDGMVGAQKDQWEQAKAAYAKGDYGGAAMGALGAAVPIIGPMINQAAEKATTGGRPWEAATDLLAAPLIGKGVGVAAEGAPAVARAASRVAPRVQAGIRAAAPSVAAGAAKIGAGAAVGEFMPDVGASPYLRYAAAAAPIYSGMRDITSGVSKGVQAFRDTPPALSSGARGLLKGLSQPIEEYKSPGLPVDTTPDPNAGPPVFYRNANPMNVPNAPDFSSIGSLKLPKATVSPEPGQAYGAAYPTTPRTPAIPGGAAPSSAPDAPQAPDFPNRGLLRKQLQRYTPSSPQYGPSRSAPLIRQMPPALKNLEEADDVATSPPEPKPAPLAPVEGPEPPPDATLSAAKKGTLGEVYQDVAKIQQERAEARAENISKYLNDTGKAKDFASGNKARRNQLIDQFNRDLKYKEQNNIPASTRHGWSERDPRTVDDLLSRLDLSDQE